MNSEEMRGFVKTLDDGSPGTMLLTGGSGLLGTQLRKLLPEMLAPGSDVFDITDYPGMVAYMEELKEKPAVLIHAAAFTKTHEAPEKPVETMEKNIVGTCNVVKLCQRYGCRLVYISTDYVFRGDRGTYSEEDELYPTNPYAWSKLGGECAVRLYPNAVIVRTSFGPEPFPFDKAFTDLWTSKLGVSELAKKLLPVINSSLTGVIHIGNERRTIHAYALAISKGKDIGVMSAKDSKWTFPKDTSLNCDKYRSLFGE